jgi:hypothetical protein
MLSQLTENKIRKLIRQTLFENEIKEGHIFRRELSNGKEITFEFEFVSEDNDIRGTVNFIPPHNPEGDNLQCDIWTKNKEYDYVQLFDGYDYLDIEKDFSDISWELEEFFKSIVIKINGYIFEDINLPINVGDEILGGKFKNKKVIVKSIDKNEKGDITINDKPLLRFRIPKKK